MRSNSAFPLIFTIFLVVCAAFVSPLQAQTTKGTVITVNDVGDTVDAAPRDGICADANGKCTLRAAIAESNATAATDAIIFDIPVPATITLTLGELQITNPVGIFGRGARQLTIQRTTTPNFSNFRVFYITSSTQMRGLTIKNGNSFTSGGGILAAADVNLYDVAITGNNARSGGGIAFQASQESHSIMERCLINSNTASAQGGGMYIGAGTYPTVKSSTFTNNSAVTGGAVANYGGLTLASDTIARNLASQGGSSILSGTGGSVAIINTIIGPDIAQTVTSVEGSFNSRGFNIITNSTGSSGWTNDDQVTTNNAIDPLLGNLADNGGQTDSMALLSGSPAINRGDDCAVLFACPGYTMFETAYDQRKFRRVAGGLTDIGAYESGSSANLNIYMIGLIFGRTQRLAFSRVTVTNTETMERRSSFIALWEPIQMREGSTRRMSFEWNGVYIAEINTKRGGLYSPTIYTLGGSSPF